MESDEENILVQNNLEVGQGQRRRNKISSFKLEPALIFIFFGWNLSDSIIPNQLLKETCLVYGFNASDCLHLGGNATKEIEEAIQPHVARILMTTSLLNSIIPAILSLFIGPWTDKFGRKKVICTTFFGFSLSLVSLAVLSFMSEKLPMVNPWVYVLPYIPTIVTGGWPTMIVSILCYVTDLTDEGNRSTRLGLIEMLVFLGILFGTASSSYILNWCGGNTMVFIISATCATLASVYTVIFVDESVETIDPTIGTCERVKELISPVPVLDMMRACFKRRPFKERRILWCLILVLMFTVFVITGSSTVSYLFVREKFQWTLKEATLYQSFNILISILGCAIGLVFFKKVLGFSDMTLAVIAIICNIADSFIKASAQTASVMYISSIVCLFKILTSPMCRSMMSTVVAKNEIGKVYSFASSFEAVSGLVAQPLYTYIYSETFTFFAGSFFLITATVYGINLVLISCVIRMRKTREALMNPYTQINS